MDAPVHLHSGVILLLIDVSRDPRCSSAVHEKRTDSNSTAILNILIYVSTTKAFSLNLFLYNCEMPVGFYFKNGFKSDASAVTHRASYNRRRNLLPV